MTTLSSSFEGDLRDALLEDVEAKLVGEQANFVYEFVELVHSNLRSYGNRHGYDVESTIESLGTPVVDRSNNSISVTVGWNSPQMLRFEFGTDDHVITPTSADVLSFVWENPPQWVREEFDQARSSAGQFQSGWRVFLPETEVSGLPESRAIRDAMNGLRRLLSA